jgi:hypothetical protein
MNSIIFKTLEEAISDVGYWRWWITDDDLIQLEFGGVQLLNSNSLDEKSKSATIGLRFSGNSFLTFFDNDEETDWHIKLQEDKIKPFTIHRDFFGFNNSELVKAIEREYANKIIIKEQSKMNKAKNIFAFKAESVAVIIGGKDFGVFDHDGEIDEDTIQERNRLWWIYWKDYWSKRETKESYDQDYACEVTIPAGKIKHRGAPND